MIFYLQFMYGVIIFSDCIDYSQDKLYNIYIKSCAYMKTSARHLFAKNIFLLLYSAKNGLFKNRILTL